MDRIRAPSREDERDVLTAPELTFADNEQRAPIRSKIQHQNQVAVVVVSFQTIRSTRIWIVHTDSTDTDYANRPTFVRLRAEAEAQVSTWTVS